MDAGIAHMPPAREAGLAAGPEDLEDGQFSVVREHAELMISWARSEAALAQEHDKLEEHAMADELQLCGCWRRRTSRCGALR